MSERIAADAAVLFVIGNIVPVMQNAPRGCIPVRIGKSRRQENFVYQESKVLADWI